MRNVQSNVTTRHPGEGNAEQALTPGLASVIIPNYNNAHYLADAIQSVLDQTYCFFEIIVVDDGSTDESRAVVARFGDQIRYIWQENQGLAGARNTGIRAAQGEFIGLLDADDQWTPAYLQTMMDLSRQYPDAAVYFSGARCMNAMGDDLERTLGIPVGGYEKIYEAIVRANFLIPSTILLRHAELLKAGLFDPSLRSCEDWDLWLRMAPQIDFRGVPIPLVRYRLHGASLTANLDGMFAAIESTMRKNFGHDDGKWSEWSPIKRRAYGGLYRFYLLNYIQRCNNWEAGAESLRRALAIDPTLSTDLDLFYELAFGAQPVEFRQTAHGVDLEHNASALCELVNTVFRSPTAKLPKRVQDETFGTMYFAIGLVAYNIGEIDASRTHLLKALQYRLDLWRDPRMRGNLLKSLVGKGVHNRFHDLQRAWLD
jgi:glycosyltransferase involved in cell wall biosynthesis